ncbi:membrane hypothetical protein [Nitrospina gracilis 3/211]|uniref:Glycosyltransferase RgtA/B/C/D-like domain-containing protein n=1 Tax=Nitrospina gracilis (strain 3/211) TaxID=1266370 RepID=M1YVV3_NITG3|nr:MULTISPECIES: hypothetical protein [Nitrospina]MCF8722795.1 hypothetical protein [Nitrospina sp. Nb-3]CCQ89749.1 membrane hypothetical protein [Nitrospina gracilis 3/211]
MTLLPATSKPWKDYAGLVGIALLAHGLVLINDGNYADGWLFNFFAERGDWDRMKAMWYEIGRPFAFWWVYLPFENFFNIYLFKFLSLLPLVLVSFIQFHFLHRFTPLSRKTAWFVAAFTLCWPFYHMIVWGAFSDHIPPVLFFGGWLLYFLHLDKNGNRLLKGVSLALLFASYFYQAFLVYHYVIVLVLFAYTMGYPPRPAWTDIRQHLPAFLKAHWAIVLVPLVFFFAKPYLFPVVGRYTGYYSIDFLSLKTLAFFAGSVANALFAPLIGLGAYYTSLPLLLIVLAGAYWVYKKKSSDPASVPTARLVWYLALGCVLIASLAYAHAANHKMGMLLSYQARHNRQMGLGAAFLTLAAIGYIGNRFVRVRWPVQRFLGFTALAILVFINISIYLTQQAHWAKNQAVIHQLKKQEPLPGVGMYFMTNHLPMGMGVDYHYAEVSLTLDAAWGGEQFIGVPPYLQKRRYDREWVGIVLNELRQGKNPLPASEAYLNEPIARTGIARRMEAEWGKGLGFRAGSKHFQPGGCLGELIVHAREDMTEALVALGYLWRRMVSPETLPAHYDRLAAVDLKPLGIDATGRSCPLEGT